MRASNVEDHTTVITALTFSSNTELSKMNDFGYNYGSPGDASMGAGGGFREDATSSNTMNEKSRPRKNYGEQTLIPCTIRMIKTVNSHQTPGGGSGGFVLPDGRELHQIKLVAAVVEVDYNSTNTSWKVEDGTGSINVKMFNNEEIPAVMDMHQQSVDGVYVRIIGQLKNEGLFQAYHVSRVKTANELTHHMLDCIYSSEQHRLSHSSSTMNTSASLKMENQIYTPMVTNNSIGPTSLQTNFSSSSKYRDPLMNAVYEYVSSQEGKSLRGTHESEIREYLQRRGIATLGKEELKNMTDIMTADGTLYSTTGDDSFRAT